MNDQEVIARQARKIEGLELENRQLRDGIADAKAEIICIGGPLNDNALRYTNKQLATFQRVLNHLEDALS